jgi:hypothetical protein
MTFLRILCRQTHCIAQYPSELHVALCLGHSEVLSVTGTMQHGLEELKYEVQAGSAGNWLLSMSLNLVSTYVLFSTQTDLC